MRRCLATTALATSMVAAGVCHAATPTLCQAGERVVFSCSTGAHIASICASKTISKDGGTLQYRYGQKNKVDLAYPETGTKPADAFTAGTMMFSGGGGAWMRFKKDRFSYTIFSAIGKWGPDGAPADASGVAVQKDGKTFSNFPCRTPSDGELGPDFFDQIGLKTSTSPDDFEIPDAFFPK